MSFPEYMLFHESGADDMHKHIIWDLFEFRYNALYEKYKMWKYSLPSAGEIMPKVKKTNFEK